MSSFNTPDESVQDTVAQLINQAANTDVVYNDANDTLTVSLTDSVSVNTLEADDGTFTTSITDPAGNIYTGSLKLTDEEVQDIIGATLGKGLEYDDAGNIIRKTRTGPNPYDAAETFTESSLSNILTNTEINNGKIRIKTKSVADRGADDDIYTGADVGRGIVINPNEDISSLTATISQNTTTVSYVTVADTNQNKIAEKTGTFNSGDNVTLNANLTKGTDYYLSVWHGSSNSFDAGYKDNPSLPAKSPKIDIVDGGYFLHPDDGFDPDLGQDRAYCISKVTLGSTETSGIVYLEWPYPSDLYEWDIATFSRTLDNETVDVYVAYSTDGGSTWIRTNGGNPISRNYSLADDGNISASDRVRIEAELSRQDTSNNPTLDSAYLSWMV